MPGVKVRARSVPPCFSKATRNRACFGRQAGWNSRQSAKTISARNRKDTATSQPKSRPSKDWFAGSMSREQSGPGDVASAANSCADSGALQFDARSNPAKATSRNAEAVRISRRTKKSWRRSRRMESIDRSSRKSCDPESTNPQVLIKDSVGTRETQNFVCSLLDSREPRVAEQFLDQVAGCKSVRTK